MKNVFALTLLILFTTNSYSQAGETAASKRVDSFVTKKMKDLHIPGMAIAVIKNGRIIKKSVYGFANLDWNNKVTEHTNFQVASCTKLLTSTLLLKTMYSGKINLEDPVTKYLDSVPAAWDDIKIKNLISHSSGIADYYESDVYLPVNKIVDVIKKAPLLFKPGTKEQYGQSDFMILAYILEKIYHKPFVQLLHDEVAVPLKMSDGAFDMEYRVEGRFLRTDIIPQKATTYYDMKGKMQAYKFLYPQYTYPAGGYFASIDDMTNWAIGLDKETLFPRIFSEQYIYARDKIGDKDAGFSKVGWALENDGDIAYGGHSGGPGLGDVWRFPKEGYTFIALSNDGELLPRFSRAIASFYITGLPVKQEIEKFDRE